MFAYIPQFSLTLLSSKLLSLRDFLVFMLSRPWFWALSSFSVVSWVMLAPLYPLHTLYSWKEVTQLHPQRRVGPQHSSWTAYSQLSPHLIYAVLSAEDSRFFQHRGVDYREIWHSISENIRHQSYRRGASTITQQLVKLITGQSQKTLMRKMRETVGAKLLEATFTKKEILTWYLNLAHFGSYANGIREAAHHYFHTTPERLTLNESIHLALILPGPNSWSQGLRHGALTDFGRKRFSALLKEMYNNRYITYRQYITATKTADFGKPLRRHAL